MQPLRYRRRLPGGACVASLGGTLEFIDVLGARPLSPDQAPFVERAMRSLFPLEVGKTANFLLTGTTQSQEGGTWMFSFEVVRREQITTPAGSFDTFLVKIVESGFSNNGFRGERAVWIDPRDNMPMRVTNRLLAGRDTSGVDWEATGFGREPNIPR